MKKPVNQMMDMLAGASCWGLMLPICQPDNRLPKLANKKAGRKTDRQTDEKTRTKRKKSLNVWLFCVVKNFCVVKFCQDINRCNNITSSNNIESLAKQIKSISKAKFNV